MHVFLHASAPDRIPSLTAELRDGGFSVVQIDSAFFRSDPETLRARSLDRASFLLVQNPRLLDQIRRLRAAKFDGPILVLRDSRDALRIVRPGGLIVWDDYQAEEPGVVRALHELAADLAIVNVRWTRLAVLTAS